MYSCWVKMRRWSGFRRVCTPLHPSWRVRKRDAQRSKPLSPTEKDRTHDREICRPTQHSAKAEHQTGTRNQRVYLITNILGSGPVLLLLSVQNNPVAACYEETPGSTEDWRVFQTWEYTVRLHGPPLCLHLAQAARSLAAALHPVTQITSGTGGAPTLPGAFGGE